jgi:hypothetical protein
VMNNKTRRIIIFEKGDRFKEIMFNLMGRFNNIFFLKSITNLSHRLVNLKPPI